ncbi:MAG: hypothetical protein R3E54_06185 [Halioglobus sp.]
MSGVQDAALLSVAGLAVSLLLPWLLGTLLIALLPWQRPQPVALLLGHGYLIGLVVMSLLVRGFSASASRDFRPAAGLATLSAGAMYLIARSQDTRTRWRATPASALRSGVPAWAVVVTVLLCLMIGFRFYHRTGSAAASAVPLLDAWGLMGADARSSSTDNQALWAELAINENGHGLFVNTFISPCWA